MKLDAMLTGYVQLFALIFFRVLSLCLIAPVFGNRAVDPRIKIGLGFFVTLALVPLMAGTHAPVARPWADLPMLIVGETSVGLLIGMIASLIFVATSLSGEMLGRHMGFGIAQVIDPTLDEESSLVGQFENLVALMLFLAICGHHILVMALCDSFEIVPIGGVRPDANMAMELVRVTGQVFPVAIKITAPAFVLLILTEVVIGLVARSVPQMNVFIVGLPLKVAIGLVGLAACVPMFSFVFEKMLRVTYGDIYTGLELMH